MGVLHAALRRQRPGLSLFHLPQGKQCLCKLRLGHGVEDIALVFSLIPRLAELVAAVFLRDAGVMASGNGVAAQFLRPVEELFKFQIAVAVDTGVRRFALAVAGNEFVHDLLPEFVGEIERIMPHPQLPGGAAGILHIVETAAGVASAQADVLILIELHRTADAGMPRVGQQLCRHAGIHAAAHGH